jgi:hypothetical protein
MRSDRKRVQEQCLIPRKSLFPQFEGHPAGDTWLAGRGDYGNIYGMSTSVPTDPNELRPLLHERLEQWAAADLPLLHHPERIVLFGSYA